MNPVSKREAKASFVGFSARLPRPGWARILGVSACLVAFVALYWHDVAVHLFGRWMNEPDYGHGFLVPLFSAFLLYRQRATLPDDRVTPLAVLAGVGLIACAVALKVGGVFGFRLLGPLSILPCIAGLVLFLRGFATLRWALPAIAFLVFMIPLPGDVGALLRNPLQRVATIASTFSLQTIGLPAVAMGNVIHLSNGQIGVVEACSGLRMVMVFFTLSAAFALLSDRPWPVRVAVVASAVPIALVANVFRIVTTGMVHEWVGPEVADRVFHDFAGLMMVPVGLALLLGFAAFLNRVAVVSESSESPLVMVPDRLKHARASGRRSR